MKLHEIYYTITNLPCVIFEYVADWRWALANDWWQLTISQLIWTFMIVSLLWISAYSIYANLRAGFFAYCDRKTGAATKIEAELVREREARKYVYTSSIAMFVIIIITIVAISIISDEYIRKMC